MNKDLLDKISKPTWEPIVEEKTGPLDDSKYFGTPWLAADEDWPEIGGLPALFVLQLNVASLPSPMSKALGGCGLVQFFYQPDTASSADYDECHLVRWVDNTLASRVLAQPPVEEYPLTGEFPKEKVIVSWREDVDYPHSEDRDSLGLNEDEVEQLQENDDIFAIQGDKLSGWPFWTQASETDDSSFVVFQLDAGCFYNGKHFPAHAPDLFASDGTGHIIVSKDNPKDLDFSWACG